MVRKANFAIRRLQEVQSQASHLNTDQLRKMLDIFFYQDTTPQSRSPTFAVRKGQSSTLAVRKH